jgi:hypothetical protein
MIAMEEIRQMPLHHKIAIMEAIWTDLSSQETDIEVPPRHKELLDERERLVAEGKAHFIDWEDAKRLETNSVADISVKLTDGIIQGEIRTPSPFSMSEIVTPNVVFVVPGRIETRFQIFVTGLAHVIEGSLAAIYINPITAQVSAATVNQGQSFVPPMNGGRSLPVIRPTRDGELISDRRRPW